MATPLQLLLFSFFFSASFAIDYSVSVGGSENNSFSPRAITTPLNIGDTITFTFSSSNAYNLYIFEGTSANCFPVTPLLGCAPAPSRGGCTLTSLSSSRAVDPYVFTITADLEGKNLVYSSLPQCTTMFGTFAVVETSSSNTTFVCSTTSGCDEASLPFCLNPDTKGAVCVAGCTQDYDCLPYPDTPTCLIVNNATYGQCIVHIDNTTCTTTMGCSDPSAPFCRNPGTEDATCVSGCENDEDCAPYVGLPFCSSEGDSTGLCVAPQNCSSAEYQSGNSCIECPQFPEQYNCATRKCTGPDSVVCLTCPPSYTMNVDGTCSAPTIGQECSLCPVEGSDITPCPESAPICCGCGVMGMCATDCFAKCDALANCTDPQCPTPSSCQTKGPCDMISNGTCLQCNPGFVLVPDEETSLGISCIPEEYRSCDSCSEGSENNCTEGTSCCCGTCRQICNIMCAKHDCDDDDEVGETTVVIVHTVFNNTCDSPSLEIFLVYIEDLVRFYLGAWSGRWVIVHTCTKGSKRQDSDTIRTEVTLTGPNTEDQADQMTNNLPQNSTANGVLIVLVSAETQDSGLSHGEIAGIVIGSVACAVLVILAILLILFLHRRRTEEYAI